jgi:glycosyltransferase involved in cell wall biosynthesis
VRNNKYQTMLIDEIANCTATTSAGSASEELTLFSDPVESKKPILMVGYFLSSSLGMRGVGEDLAIQLKNSGWNVIVTSNKITRAARLVDMIKTVVQQRHNYAIAQVDVYSGLAFFWAEVVCQILRRLGKPYILSLHGGNLPHFAAQRARRVSHLLRSAAAVTAPSRYLLEQLRAYRADLHLLPNALDLTAYNFTLREYPEPHIVWLRAFHEVYNPCLAAQAVVLLAKDHPEVRLAMVGPDKGDGSLQRLHQLAVGSGVANRIILPGAVPKQEVSNWMNKGDIFLNTSEVDNTPISVLEAMACGLCVVSTNVGGISYLLEHECDSLLVPPNDHIAMARAVHRVLHEPGLAKRLSLNARRKAEKFDWSAVLPEWQALLKSVAER